MTSNGFPFFLGMKHKIFARSLRFSIFSFNTNTHTSHLGLVLGMDLDDLRLLLGLLHQTYLPYPRIHVRSLYSGRWMVETREDKGRRGRCKWEI